MPVVARASSSSFAATSTSAIHEPPSGASRIVAGPFTVSVQSFGAMNVFPKAWKAYRPEAKWPIKVSNDLPDRDGWSKRRVYEYLTSPNEKREVAVLVSYSGTSWTVVIEDMADAVAEKRGGQIGVALGRLMDGAELQWLRQVKRRQALQGCNHAEG